MNRGQLRIQQLFRIPSHSVFAIFTRCWISHFLDDTFSQLQVPCSVSFMFLCSIAVTSQCTWFSAFVLLFILTSKVTWEGLVKNSREILPPLRTFKKEGQNCLFRSSRNLGGEVQGWQNLDTFMLDFAEPFCGQPKVQVWKRGIGWPSKHSFVSLGWEGSVACGWKMEWRNSFKCD